MLNAIYAKHAPRALPTVNELPTKQGDDIDSDASSTSTSTSDAEPSKSESSQQQEHLLLTRDAVPEITAHFDSRPDSTLAGELYRALEQAGLRLQGPERQSRS